MPLGSPCCMRIFELMVFAGVINILIFSIAKWQMVTTSYFQK